VKIFLMGRGAVRMLDGGWGEGKTPTSTAMSGKGGIFRCILTRIKHIPNCFFIERGYSSFQLAELKAGLYRLQRSILR
jgi:hypothetical protein